ncbi:MAG: sulfite exporter TauE/SafE family protein [Crocinitomicaceae bacterium]|nr:sulfite exporter TauE/SafE family protein [Crocinitomicaceae bacterium]
MLWIGLFISLIIGTILGLVGGGGSILTVPLVHYLFGASMVVATTYSLFVVSIASGVGTIQRVRSKQVDWKHGIIFLIPSMFTAFSIRQWMIPSLGDQFVINGFIVSTENLISFILVSVMVYTAIKTLLSKERDSTNGNASIINIILFGILTGILSGLIGAGGGFIIVPILLRLGLAIRTAIGTSMFIISVQSAIALIGDISNEKIWESGFDWQLLLFLTIATISGVFIGNYLQKFFSGKILRKIFSFILLAVSVGIAIQKFVL